MARKPMDGDTLAKRIVEMVLAAPPWSVKRVEALYLKHRPAEAAPAPTEEPTS